MFLFLVWAFRRDGGRIVSVPQGRIIFRSCKRVRHCVFSRRRNSSSGVSLRSNPGLPSPSGLRPDPRSERPTVFETFFVIVPCCSTELSPLSGLGVNGIASSYRALAPDGAWEKRKSCRFTGHLPQSGGSLSDRTAGLCRKCRRTVLFERRQVCGH